MPRDIAAIHRPRGGPVTKKDPSTTSVIIYSCGNYKMKSLGPKPLIKVYGNINLLDYQIDIIKRVIPNVDILVCVGEDAEKVVSNKKKSTRIIENQQFNETNEVEYIRLGMNATTTDKVIIINGDIIFNIDHIRYFHNNKGSCTLFDIRNLKDDEIGIVANDGKMTSMGYKLEKKWTSLISFVGDDIDLISKILNNRSRKRQYFFEALNSFLDRKMIKVEEAQGTLIKVDSAKSLEGIPIEHFNS